MCAKRIRHFLEGALLAADDDKRDSSLVPEIGFNLCLRRVIYILGSRCGPRLARKAFWVSDAI